MKMPDYISVAITDVLELSIDIVGPEDYVV